MNNKERVIELINMVGNSLDAPAYAKKTLTECGKEILDIIENLEKKTESLKFDCCMYEEQINKLNDKSVVEVMTKTNKEILDIFGEYEKVIMDIGEHVVKGKSSGSMEWFFYREDYDTITPEMEEIFDGEDIASICIEWSLDIG